ncbi:MAG: thiol:disulfide interchange protein DsbG [Alphaproteobacteria bacterium]|nr:thiol:disulfide interchange protein DsbG [Alphaproteobacteria bacterium]
MRVLHSRKMVLGVAAAVLLWAAVPETARSQAGEVISPLRALRQAKWVPEGSTHPHQIIYVFMDANCPYCHALWLALKPYYRTGLQVRDILVGVISASSPGKAAAIFDAPDPSAELRRNENRWGHGPDYGGGIAPVSHPSTGDLSEIESNEALMQAFGIEGTPGLVFADARGRVYVVPGVPGKAELGHIVQAAAVSRGGGQMN